jgi:hypothetical protein
LIRAHWRGANGSPPSRWISRARRDLSEGEYGALLTELDDVIRSNPTPAARENRSVADPRLSLMSDAQLMAEALGERVD